MNHVLVSDVVLSPDAIPVGSAPEHYLFAKPPGRYSALLTVLQRHGTSNAAWLFTVTAGDESYARGRYCILCALAMGCGVRYGEVGYGTYQSCCRLVVKYAGRLGMLNHMSGKSKDTPLMKAAANGNKFLVEELLRAHARSPHLGYLIPPIWLVYF